LSVLLKIHPITSNAHQPIARTLERACRKSQSHRLTRIIHCSLSPGACDTEKLMGGARLPSSHQTPSNKSNKALKVSVSTTFQKISRSFGLRPRGKAHQRCLTLYLVDAFIDVPLRRYTPCHQCRFRTQGLQASPRRKEVLIPGDILLPSACNLCNSHVRISALNTPSLILIRILGRNKRFERW